MSTTMSKTDSRALPPPYNKFTTHSTMVMSPPPTQPAPVSQIDTESLLRQAEVQGHQYLQLSEAAMRFLRRYGKTNVLLEEVLLHRSQIIHVRQQGDIERQFVNDSQDSFLREAHATLDSLPPSPSLEKLQTLHDQVLRDHERRREHVWKTQEAESHIAEREYTLQKNVTRLAQSAKTMVDILEGMGLPEVTVEDRSPPSTATGDPEAEVPNLVQHYFGKIGDVKLASERLVDLEIDHRDSRVDRMFRFEQGRPPSMTDEEFENAFDLEYQQARGAYDEAVRKAELARMVCLGEGINPDDFLKPPSATERSGSGGIRSSAAEAEPKTQSNSDYAIGEAQVPTYEPVYEPLLVPPDESIYPPWPRVYTASPVVERVQTWLQDEFQPDPWEPGENGRRSLSAARLGPFEIKPYEDGSLGVFEASSRSRKQQSHRNLPPMVRRLVDVGPGKERPVLLKKSFSESELLLLTVQYMDRESTFDDLRSFTERWR